jgi:hypothetical protein
MTQARRPLPRQASRGQDERREPWMRAREVSSVEEPQALTRARRRLSRAEARYLSVEGLADLEEALLLLEGCVVSREAHTRETAANLFRSYSQRLFARVAAALDEPATPEPLLEHMFKLLLAFDQAGLELPPTARSTKVKLVERLIELYFEGGSAAERQEMLQRLARLADGG